MTETPTTRRNRSAACGTWAIRQDDGELRQAHEHCSRYVNTAAYMLPTGDPCSCWCHGAEDGDAFDGTSDEWALMVETHEQWRSEQSGLSFADWLIEDDDAEVERQGFIWTPSRAVVR